MIELVAIISLAILAMALVALGQYAAAIAASLTAMIVLFSVWLDDV